MNGSKDTCDNHSGVCERINGAERNIEKIWKTIDGIRGWVMAGMGALILQLVIFVAGKL